MTFMSLKAVPGLPVLAALILCGGCGLTTSRDSPYGLWKTNFGQTVEVRRNGTFVFCDGEVCETGVARPDDGQAVWLVNFGRMESTAPLRAQSGWDAIQARSGVVPEVDYQLGDVMMSWPTRWQICQGRPCVTIGGRRSGNRFVKLKDG